MNAKTTIRKILFVSVWVCIGAGMLTLLLAAISRKNKGRCKDYVIAVKGSPDNLFIDKNDVEQLLKKATKGAIKGQPIASFNLDQLEQLLKQNSWINKAELYFDNRDVLHVAIKEREPVARIFTTGDNSFYIDSLGSKIPLSGKLSAKVPVFTGFPDKKILTAKDSVLLNDIRVMAGFIISDPFWMAQVAQVNITTGRTFEMTPVVGNHIVLLGNGSDIDKKFHRLMMFYRQVLSKTGFDKYKMIDVQYKGQVVVSRQLGNTKVDSVQLRKNVEKLLRQSREAGDDTVVKAVPLAESSASGDHPQQISGSGPQTSLSKPPAKRISGLKPVKPNEKKSIKEPKATMPKKETEAKITEYN